VDPGAEITAAGLLEARFSNHRLKQVDAVRRHREAVCCDQVAADSAGRRPELGDEDRAAGAEHAEHLADRLGAQRLGQVMDHQAAHHDVVGAVRGVEGLGDPVGEGAVCVAGETLGLRDRLAGGVHALGATPGRDGLGHQAGEIPGAAADVEHPVAGAGAACGGQLAEDTTSTAAEQDGSADVVGASMADEPARRAAVRIAVPRVRQFHRDLFLSEH
jgi:hypothetical protein